LGTGWSVSLGGYARRFEDVPRWRPVGSRDLTRVVYDDGTAAGLELLVRRHAGRVTGWVGYGYGNVLLEEAETGREYHPAWDRRHAVDAALFFRPDSKWSLSARAVYGSGLPFWPFAGFTWAPRFNPLAGGTDLNGLAPVWADEQMRYPDYFRLDTSIRRRGRVGPIRFETFVSLLNVTRRPNVLYYKVATDGDGRESLGKAMLE